MPLQLFRFTARVENVLRGRVPQSVEVYYLSSMRDGGLSRMGMSGHGGSWKIGDRLIFFIQRDSGVYRTVLDTWANPPFAVLTGAHPGYKTRPGESIEDSIIDILLDKGEKCTDKDLADAVTEFRLYRYDVPYALKKLRAIAASGGPYASAAAAHELRFWRDAGIGSPPNESRPNGTQDGATFKSQIDSRN